MPPARWPIRPGCHRRNSLSAVLRQAWDGEDLSVLTVTSRQKVPRVAKDVHVAVLGQISAAELRGLHQSTDVRNGFLNRFCMVYVERSRLLPFAECISETVLNPIASRLQRGVDQSRISTGGSAVLG